MKRFNPSSKHPARAVQAWQILVSAAMNRQTLTYKRLARLMYRRDAPGVLDKILVHLAGFGIVALQPFLAGFLQRGAGLNEARPDQAHARCGDVFHGELPTLTPP